MWRFGAFVGNVVNTSVGFGFEGLFSFWGLGPSLGSQPSSHACLSIPSHPAPHHGLGDMSKLPSLYKTRLHLVLQSCADKTPQKQGVGMAGGILQFEKIQTGMEQIPVWSQYSSLKPDDAVFGKHCHTPPHGWYAEHRCCNQLSLVASGSFGPS